jgi:NAD(P)-dependent dehydrogenase (short-subunit alcohol dehydrogenase family)
MQNQPKEVFPPQHQDTQPGIESAMNPAPVYDNPAYRPANKLQGKTAFITGGDSGIGRAVALAYAKEGANVAIVYLRTEEDGDADETIELIKAIGGNAIKYRADLRNENEAASAVKFTVDNFGGLDILINNAAVQFPQNSISDISREQLTNTFETNIYSYFFTTKAALPHLKNGSTIINTASVVAFKGSPRLIDYSSTKGAIMSFTRSMAMSLVKQGIRVNAVAPGPVWTPLIVSSFSAEEAAVFGSDTPMGRAAQPYELAPLYVFLANDDSSNITGQVFHINSGEIVD